MSIQFSFEVFPLDRNIDPKDRTLKLAATEECGELKELR